MRLESLQQSRAPFRAKRCSEYYNVIIANNRGTFRGRPGVYRLQGNYDLDETFFFRRIFFAVSKNPEAIDVFPLTTTEQNIKAEILGVFATPAVEVELREDEFIHFWEAIGALNPRVKIVMVDNLDTVESSGVDTELHR